MHQQNKSSNGSSRGKGKKEKRIILVSQKELHEPTISLEEIILWALTSNGLTYTRSDTLLQFQTLKCKAVTFTSVMFMKSVRATYVRFGVLTGMADHSDHRVVCHTSNINTRLLGQ
jgi:hypothetical protein